MNARSRVERLLAAARRAADPADPIGAATRRELLITSGLSREGVELALTAHLETSVGSADLDALVARTGEAPRCHVILSANVCTAALRALAVALATSPTVVCKPSRRDPTLARQLARALTEDPSFAATGAHLDIADELHPEPGDELHVYGADATIAAVARAAPAGVIMRRHGTGLGLAVVASHELVDVAARAIARDVVPFDQRGCLSPRAVLVEGDPARARAVANALHEALGALSSRVPRGELTTEDRAAIASYRATVQAIGELLEGSDHLVGLDEGPRSLVLPPAVRAVHVVPAPDARLVDATWARFLTCIGADGDHALAASVAALAPFARRSKLGFMQRPPLDGPVDRRPT